MKELVESPVSDPELFLDFGVFYREVWNRVYGPLAVTLRDHQLAAESVDEAMVRAFQNWSRVRSYDNPVGWVYRVAMNYARNRLRRRWREVSWGSVEPTWEMATPNPELMTAILSLPLHQRQIVVLRYVFDWSIPEIGKALGIPEGTVKSRLHRALGVLKEVVQ
jgi:RNA polymerase sigma-70 factor (ECF subfamily)